MGSRSTLLGGALLVPAAPLRKVGELRGPISLCGSILPYGVADSAYVSVDPELVTKPRFAAPLQSKSAFAGAAVWAKVGTAIEAAVRSTTTTANSFLSTFLLSVACQRAIMKIDLG